MAAPTVLTVDACSTCTWMASMLTPGYHLRPAFDYRKNADVYVRPWLGTKRLAEMTTWRSTRMRRRTESTPIGSEGGVLPPAQP